MTDQNERMEKLLKTTPETEILYICDENGKTKLMVRGAGLAIVFGILNILHSFSTSSGRSFANLIADLQMLHRVFEMAIRKKAEPENGGNAE